MISVSVKATCISCDGIAVIPESSGVAKRTDSRKERAGLSHY